MSSSTSSATSSKRRAAEPVPRPSGADAAGPTPQGPSPRRQVEADLKPLGGALRDDQAPAERGRDDRGEGQAHAATVRALPWVAPPLERLREPLAVALLDA